jgi:hypothetical protein
MTKKQRIPFGKVLPASLILILCGAGGLLYILMNTQPFLGPRWLMFFFTTLLVCGVGLPLFTLLQNRFSQKGVTEGVLVRETIMLAVYVDLLLWLQLGRVLSNTIMVLLGMGFLLLEIFLRISEKAVFRAEEDIHE